MGKRAEQRMNEKRKLNKIKVIMALIILAITITIVVSVFILKDDNKENKNEVIEEETPLIEIEEKTVEEVVAEFGGSIIEKVKPDTCYVSKNEKEYTVNHFLPCNWRNGYYWIAVFFGLDRTKSQQREICTIL